MKIIDKVIKTYIDWKIAEHKHNPRKCPKHTVVTWDWMARYMLTTEEKETFVVCGYYEGGIETKCGQLISDFWIRRV